MSSRDPRVDAYIAKAAPFARPILDHLRDCVHAACPAAQETLKWRSPHFTYNDRLLCGMAAFKQHVAFGFWLGDLVAGTGRDEEAMGQFGRIARLDDLPSRRALGTLVKKAMGLTDAGVTRAPMRRGAPRPTAQAPDDLVAALAKHRKARETFERFSNSQRRDYIEWISEAKREATRAQRLATTLEWLAEGKSRNWKYETR
jgi:uncharacterized protein YdeI (YjbR/CyaY-like superfamily)